MLFLLYIFKHILPSISFQMNATDKMYSLMNSIRCVVEPAFEIALITAQRWVGATDRAEICKKLEIFMKRKTLARDMMMHIIANAQDMMRKSREVGSGYSEYCALYLSLDEFVRENHMKFFTSRSLNGEYYAMRMVIKEYVLLPSHSVTAHIWALQHSINPSEPSFGMSRIDDVRTYYSTRDQVEMYGYDDKPFTMCGCHDSERISEEINELVAFDRWGPGIFIENVLLTPRDIAQYDNHNILRERNIWRFNRDTGTATIWNAYTTPEELTYEDFHDDFANDTADRHFAWKHDMASIFKVLRNYDTMFSAPQLPDYSQVMLQIQAKTNGNCMRLIDEFCGIF